MKTVWDKLDETEKENLMSFNEAYRQFLSRAKTEREFTSESEKLAKEAGANIRIKKNVVIDLELIEKYLENNCEGAEGEM